MLFRSAEGLGIAVGERDVDGLAGALATALYDDDFVRSCRDNVARVRQGFTWEHVLEPLADFCRRAERSADASDLTQQRKASVARPAAALPGGVLGRNLHYARSRVREGGITFAAKRALAKGRRLATGGRG